MAVDMHAPTAPVWAVVEQEMRDSMPVRDHHQIRPSWSAVLTGVLAIGLSLGLTFIGVVAGYAHARSVYHGRVMHEHTNVYYTAIQTVTRMVYVPGATTVRPAPTVTRTVAGPGVPQPGPTVTVTATVTATASATATTP